jgi:hypothetical protein
MPKAMRWSVFVALLLVCGGAAAFVLSRFTIPSAPVHGGAEAAIVHPVSAVSPVLPAKADDHFIDVTTKAGLSFTQVLADGEMSNVVEATGSGGAFIDYDGDGWLDIFLVQSGWAEGFVQGEPSKDPAVSRLFRNRGDGTFDDVTQKVGLGQPGFGTAAVACDFDADGDTDLYVCNAGPNRLYRNDGGRFTDVATEAGVADPSCSVGATFFDYDKDGDLDLYVVNYVVFDPKYRYFYGPDGFPPPLSYEAGRHTLYRNEGNGRFADVSQPSGIAAGQGRGMSVCAADFDEDGWTDLFVANDMTANFLWRNMGDGTFKDVAIERGVAYGSSGDATGAMTGDVGDFDRDGKLDLFVSAAAYGSLYHNLGEGMYSDITVESRIAQLTGQYVSWGGGFLDYDLDGDRDILVVNGDLHHIIGWEDLLLENRGDGTFADAVDAASYFRQKLMGRGGIVADYDNDGDPDALITNIMDRPVLLQNQCQNKNNNAWLTIALQGAGGNRPAYGSRVRIVLDDGRGMLAEMRCPTTYLGTGDPRLLFGLGQAQRVSRVEVQWPNGQKQVLENVPVRQHLKITQAKP